MPDSITYDNQRPISEALGDFLRVSTGITLPAAVGMAGLAAGAIAFAPASLLIMVGGLVAVNALGALDNWLDDPKRSPTTRKVGKVAMTTAGVVSAAALVGTLAVVAPAALVATAAVAAVGLAAYGVSKLVEKFRGKDAAEKAPAPVGRRVASAAAAGALAAGVALAPPVVPVADAAGAVARAAVKTTAGQAADQSSNDQKSSARDECEPSAAARADRASDQERRRLARWALRRILTNPILFPFPGSPFLFPMTSLPLAGDLFPGNRAFSGILGDASRSAARAASSRVARAGGQAATKALAAPARVRAPALGINDSLKDSVN